MPLNYRRLVEAHTRSQPSERGRVVSGTRHAFEDAGIRDSFDLGRLFEECFGWEEFRACRRDRQTRTAHQVFEAAGAVSTAAFQNIMGQWAYTTFLQAYAAPELVFSKIIPTRSSPFKTERIPGISNIGDEALVVDEAKDYPIAGVSENWIETPETLKRGFIVPCSWEALFFDRTGQVRGQLGQLGTWLGVNKEKRAIDCVIDAGETAQNKYRYRWLGNVIATYGSNSGSHTWNNQLAATPLSDYTSLQAAWNVFKQLTDPFTGEPLDIMPKDIVVPPLLAWAVPFATGGAVRRANPGYATTGNPTVTEINNPSDSIMGQLRTLTSQLLRTRLGSDTTWFVGDVARAVAYMENLPLEVTTAPAGSEAEFTRDIVLRTKVREMGTYSTQEPRAMVKVLAS